MEETGSFQADWNLAYHILPDIANRLKNARDYFLRGDLDKYYWYMETVVRSIYGFLDETETKKITIVEEDIQKYLPSNLKNKGELSKKIKNYDNLIMQMLQVHKLLVPPKKDRTRLLA